MKKAMLNAYRYQSERTLGSPVLEQFEWHYGIYALQQLAAMTTPALLSASASHELANCGV